MIDFKSDLAQFRQETDISGIGQQPINQATPNMDLAQSPTIDSQEISVSSFADDLNAYKQETAQIEPIGVASEVSSRVNALSGELIDKQNEENLKVQEETLKANEFNMANAPDKLEITPNIEIDYRNQDLTKQPINTIPDGTVGGQCGVFAENIVKLPGGKNWIVGDTIKEKAQAIERYKKAGLAFKQGEDVPQPGNAVIINPGTKWGHVAVINNIDENGIATLSESNWNWDKKVTNNRRINLNDPSIVGFIRTK